MLERRVSQKAFNFSATCSSLRHRVGFWPRCPPQSVKCMDSLRSLFDAALGARARSYAPYSNFAVGAALRGVGGRVFTGANIENSAYPLGMCAEAGAISAMVMAGERAVAEILVVADSAVAITPCGACRQRLAEFGAPDIKVHAADLAGWRATFTLGDLLPEAFGAATLASAAP